MYYDAVNDRVVIMGQSFYKKGRLYITSQSIKKEIVSNLLKQVDNKILSDKNYVNSVIDKTVVNILNTKVYSNGSTNKNVNDLFNSVYYSNLAGDEKAEAWVNLCAADFKNGKNVDKLINTISKDISSVINEKASSLTIDTDKIISRGSGFTSIVMREVVVILLGDNLQEVISTGKINVNNKVIEFINSCLKDGKKEKYSNLAYDTIKSMATDTNYPEDNNTVINN